MDNLEIGSFISKFMGLLRSGKNASLNIKSEAGKAYINLSVEVPSLLNRKPRNGPARQRRRERRAAACDAAVETVAAEEAEKEESEKDLNVKAAEKQQTTSENEVLQDNKNRAVIVEPNDEIENISIRSEPKSAQARPNDICGTISVIPIRHLNATNEHLSKSIAAKIEAKKVKVCDIFIQRSAQGVFTRCDVQIEAVNGNLLENIDFEFENCQVVPFYGLRIM